MQLLGLCTSARFVLALALLIFFHPYTLFGYELNKAEVSEHNGVFRILLTATFDTPADYVRQVLSDYTHIYRLSSSIVESEILPATKPGVTRLRTKILACASIFCTEVERVDAIHTLASGEVRADIVPELSEFRSGQATWKITALDNRSKIDYVATVEPDFYIPPIVGIPLISRSLLSEYLATLERLNIIASINAERDWNEEHTVASVNLEKSRKPCAKKINAGL